MTGDVNQICVDRAARVALGVMQYVQDWDDQFPPMQTPAKFEAAVNVYVGNRADFVCPATNKPFVPNPNLSYVQHSHIANPAATVLFSDPDSHQDGIKTVAYADGHVVHGNYHPTPNPPPTAAGGPCAQDERQIGLAVGQYVQDYDENYPVFGDYGQFKAAVLPYVKNADLFKCPSTGLDYVVNTQLSGVGLGNIPDPSSTWLLRDAAVNRDGTFNTLMVDGHIHTTYYMLPIALSVLPGNGSRLLWYAADGRTRIWALDATGAYLRSATVAASTTPIIGMATDIYSRTILMRGARNTDTLQVVMPSGAITKTLSNGPYDGWDPTAFGIASNGQGHMLWNRFDGQASVWTLKTDRTYMTDVRYGPVPGAVAKSLVVAPDDTQRLTLLLNNGALQICNLDAGGNFLNSRTVGPMAGWTPVSLAVGPDNVTRLLWANANHGIRIWTVPVTGAGNRSIYLQTGGDWQPVSFGVGRDGSYRVLFAGAAGARVDVISATGAVLSSNVLPRP